MKKTIILLILLSSMIIFFYSGCSVPGIEKQTKNTEEISLLSTNDAQNKVPAQHPAVYEARILSGSEYYYSSLVWVGNEYGVACIGDNNVYFARISRLGAKIGKSNKITTSNNVYERPSLVWTGSEYGVAWTDHRDDHREIYFTRISSSGSKIGNDIRISTNDYFDSYQPSLVWTGSEYGVAFTDYRDSYTEIYFARISSSGSKIGNDIRISTNDDYASNQSFLVWTGSEYGVGWQDERNGSYEVYFARISSSGSKIGNDIIISANDDYISYMPSLVWTGNGYGVAWTDSRDSSREIYFARISSNGSKIGNDIKISANDDYDSNMPSLVWTGIEYGIAWFDNRDDFSEIYYTRINSSGSKIGNDIRISANDDYFSELPSLVWTGTEYGVAWSDYRDNNNINIYFARFNASGTKQAQGGLVGALTGSQEGYYYIRNYEYGTYLRGYSSPVTLREYCLSDHIKWTLSDSNNDGYYEIRVKSSHKYLTGLINGDGNLTGVLGVSAEGDQANIHLWQLDSRLDTGLGKYILRIKKDTDKRIYASGETSVDLRDSNDYWQLIPAGD